MIHWIIIPNCFEMDHLGTAKQVTFLDSPVLTKQTAQSVYSEPHFVYLDNAKRISSPALSTRNSGIFSKFPSRERFISENLTISGVCS